MYMGNDINTWDVQGPLHPGTAFNAFNSPWNDDSFIWWLPASTFPTGITLQGVCRFCPYTSGGNGETKALRGEIWWRHPDVESNAPQKWGASQTSPKHCYFNWFFDGTITFLMAKGVLDNRRANDLPCPAQMFVTGPRITLPPGAQLGCKLILDDSYTFILDEQTQLNAGTRSPTPDFVFFNFGGSTPFQTDGAYSFIEFLTPLDITGFDQASLRGRNDDGDLTTATWKAATNVGWAQPYDENFRIRVSIDEVGGDDAPATAFKLQVGGSAIPWTDVTATSSYVRTSLSPNVTDGAATTLLLNTALGGGAFVAGEYDEVTGAVAAVDMGVYGKTEFEWSLTMPSTGTAVPNETEVRFRVVESDGTVLTRYGGNPIITTPAAEEPPGEAAPTKWVGSVVVKD
jgi:hypothetical protein